MRTFGGRDDEGSNCPENIQECAQYHCEHKMTLLQVAGSAGLLAGSAGLLADSAGSLAGSAGMLADSVGLFIALPLRDARASMSQFLSVKEDYRRHPQAHGRPVS